MKSIMSVNSYGDKEWRNEKGEYHREDGPAIEYADGIKCWSLNGRNYTEADFLRLTAKPLFSEKEKMDIKESLIIRIHNLAILGATAKRNADIERLELLLDKMDRF